MPPRQPGSRSSPTSSTTAPSGLYIERGPDGKYLLRFANTAVNMGGRLEIAVGKGTRDIYQNVYDNTVGGNQVVHQKVGADLIYHPQHNHFHFEDFAKYELLKRDAAGFYRATNRTGSKTTYCILDSIRIGQDGPAKRQYDGCGATVQGLSAGWGDTYIASLFGQWIDLGAKICRTALRDPVDGRPGRQANGAERFQQCRHRLLHDPERAAGVRQSVRRSVR